MQCPKCNTENPEGAKFCLNCAAKLVLVCAQCGTELPPHAKFCFNCAAPITVPPPTPEEEAGPPALVLSQVEGLDKAIQRLVPREFAERLLATRGQVGKERRTVTILFSDVKGSTAMAESLDPEDWMEIMEGAFDVLIEPVYRYEGTVARLMGDAILAFFGAPIAHEDDPERACRAALEIIEGAQRYAAQLEEKRGISGFNVRVGINTGLVVVGEVGSDLRMEYTAMGDAVNLAARMESAAEAGTILITEATHKFIAPLFETEAVGPIKVKGKVEPVPVYRVLAPKVAPGRLRGIAGLESPLVGRDAEFRALREAVERLGDGVGGIVTIVGEAGLGKSRMVAELRKEAPSLNLQWVEGRCVSYGTSIAYLLWLDVLRGLLGATAEDSPVAVRDALRERVQALCPERSKNVYPYLARLMSLPLEEEDEVTLQSLEGEQLKANTFRAVETLIECAASERPLVIVCEDLHWADPTSIELLQHLLALTDRVPLLILCVLRPQREHGCWQLIETAARLHRHHHVNLWLDPLSATESERLVDNLLHKEGIPQKLKWRIFSYTEGNPFYVEEILRSLIDDGAIVRDEATGRWQATRDVADVAIPDTLHGVLMARIDRLQEEVKRVLQLASVIGRIFLYRILVAIARGERELDQHLLTLQQEEMIRERAKVPDLEYIFKHHLTQEAAYNGLLKKERRVFHRQVAEALERLFTDRIEEQVGLLAHHWQRAEEPEKAMNYLLRAGHQAKRAYANEEAIHYLRTALEVVEKVTGDVHQERITIHEHLSDVLVNIGQYDEALKSYVAALDLLEGFALLASAPELAAALHRKVAVVYRLKGEYTAALEWLSRAQEKLDDERNVEMARICTSTATVLYRQGEATKALEWCQRGLEIAQGVEERRELAHAYMLRGTIHGDLGDLDWAISDCLESLDICQEMEESLLQAKAHNGLGANYYYKGDWERAVAHYRQSLEIRERIGDVNGMATVSNNLGELYLNQGRFDKAVECFRRCLETWERTGFPLGVALSYRNLGQVCIRREEWSAALDHLETSLQMLEEIGSRDWLMAEVYRHLAEVHLGLSQPGTAWRHGERSLDIAVAQEIRLVEGNARRVLGQVYHCQGQWNDAEALLRESLKLSEEQGLRYEAGQALWELALLYQACTEPCPEHSRRGSRSDRARAKGDEEHQTRMAEALDRAIAIFEELGAQWDLARARDLTVHEVL